MFVNAVQASRVSRAILYPDDFLDVINRMLKFFFSKIRGFKTVDLFLLVAQNIEYTYIYI